MSVRAYKVVSIATENEPRFNLWHDDELVELLHPYNQLDQDGGGLVCFAIEELEEALRSAEGSDTQAILRKMLADAAEDGYVEYLCL